LWCDFKWQSIAPGDSLSSLEWGETRTKSPRISQQQDDQAATAEFISHTFARRVMSKSTAGTDQRPETGNTPEIKNKKSATAFIALSTSRSCNEARMSGGEFPLTVQLFSNRA
jgi:hypothetical protein